MFKIFLRMFSGITSWILLVVINLDLDEYKVSIAINTKLIRVIKSIDVIVLV